MCLFVPFLNLLQVHLSKAGQCAFGVQMGYAYVQMAAMSSLSMAQRACTSQAMKQESLTDY